MNIRYASNFIIYGYRFSNNDGIFVFDFSCDIYLYLAGKDDFLFLINGN